MAVTWKKLAYEDDVVKKAAFTAKGDILVSSGDATPVALEVGENGQVLTADSAEDTGVKWAATGTGDFKANGTVPMTGNLQLAGNQLTNHVVHTVADEAGLNGLTAVVGKMAWRTDTLALYLCTSDT